MSERYRPEQIYLQVTDGIGEPINPDTGEVTWCEDEQDPSDVKYIRADIVRKLEAIVERGPEIRIADGDVWLSFGKYAQVSVEALIEGRGRGPIVKKNMKKWRDDILADLEDLTTPAK